MKGQMKQNVMLVAMLAAGLMGTGALPASAAIILDDDFVGAAGTAADALNWSADAPPKVQLDGGGHVTLDATSGGAAFIVAKNSLAFKPTGDKTNGTEFARLTVNGFVFSSKPAGNIVFGLADGTDTQSIYIRNDLSDGVGWTVELAKSGGKVFAKFTTDISRDGGNGDWVIDWYTNQVVVSHNRTVILDTMIHQPTTNSLGTTGWVFPDTLLAPQGVVYSSGVITFDRMTWQTGAGANAASCGQERKEMR